MGNKILSVDDEEAWSRTIGTFLKLAGYQVVTARDGKGALVQADVGDLGLIILDVNLAGEESAQLMKSLKEKHPGTPIVLYTGLEAGEEAVQRLMKQGADQYLRKGNLRDLLKCIEELSRKFGAILRGFRPAMDAAGAWQTL